MPAGRRARTNCGVVGKCGETEGVKTEEEVVFAVI